MPRVELKRSTPVEFSYKDASGKLVTFAAPACTVGGYRRALELEQEASEHRLLDQGVALCGEGSRPHLEALEVGMLQEVIQAQVALYSGLDPVAATELMRTVKKKAVVQFVTSLAAATS